MFLTAGLCLLTSGCGQRELPANITICNANEPESLAPHIVTGISEMRITKALFDNLEDFKKLHPAIANITKEQMLAGNTVPFHPGAMKYFKEKGLMK